MNLDELLAGLREAVSAGNVSRAEELTREGLAAGYDPMTLIDQGLRPGMDEVGERFACAEAFIPDLVMSGKAMKAAITLLDPVLKTGHQERQVLGKVVIGTVRGDIHEIGKTLVGTMLTANGFEVRDLGVDVPAEKFVEEVRAMDADLVGLSALLTTTMISQKAVIEALKEAGLRERVKVMVGGAPVSASWAAEIGADAYAENATEAARIAKSLIGAG
jgi:corrinoid protein of di/trimethylamine methyltransferase